MRSVMVFFLLGFAGAFQWPAAVPASAEALSPAQRRPVVGLPDQAVASLPAAPADPDKRPALIVLLHGAGQTPEQMIAIFENDAACRNAVLLAPKSLGQTWDVVAMAIGRAMEASLSSDVLRYSSSKDAERVMSAISQLQQTISTDPSRQVLVGFSDGATFALALGTGRDRPFTAVVGLSPGLAVVPARAAPRRPVLVMHGRSDRSLSFDFTKGTIVPTLRGAGVKVEFVAFPGGHEIAAGAHGALAQLIIGFGRDEER